MNIIRDLTLEISSLISRLEAQKKETRYWKDRCTKAEAQARNIFEYHYSSVERLARRIEELESRRG